MADFKVRIEELVHKYKADLKKDLGQVFKQTKKNWEDGWVLSSANKDMLQKKYEIANIKELLVFMASVKHAITSADISDFDVQVVAQEKSGDVLFGGNLEFPGSDLGLTIHAEQFLMA